MTESINDLMKPIPGANPAGEDMVYSVVFDQIREARRQDDPSLALGEWEVPLKVADWPRVVRLCEDTLQHKSKDLQLLVWYAEAMVRHRGFAGAGLGLRAIAGWLSDYWEQGFPEYNPQDLDERIGKFEWLNQHVALALRQVPVVSPAYGGYHWLDWHQSREVDNLGLKSPDAKQAALDEGKLSGEMFDKSAVESGRQWFAELAAALSELVAAYAYLDEQLVLRFAEQAPALVDLRDAIHACQDLITRYRQRWEEALPELAPPRAIVNTNRPVSPELVSPVVTTMPEQAKPTFNGQIQHRQEAVLMLREVARYFRQHEPHSPVPLLAERAARWAEMSLEEWLLHVVKDESTLQQLRELLDVRSD